MERDSGTPDFFLRRLRVRNFRRIDSLDVRIPDAARVICLVGTNGSGKSSLISILLHSLVTLSKESTPDITREPFAPQGTRFWSTTERTRNTPGYAVRADWSVQGEAASFNTKWLEAPGGQSIEAALELSPGPYKEFSSGWVSRPSGDPVAKSILLERPGGRHETPYYEEERDKTITPRVGHRWLGHRPLPVRCTSGLNELESLILDLAIDSSVRTDPNTDVVAQQAIAKLVLALRDLTGDEASFSVGPWPYRRVGSGHVAALSLLSSGELDVMVTIGAIVAQEVYLARVAGGAPTESVGGVVFIDEFDKHLHPRWQEKVIPILLSLFPRVQFIIGSHSPFVVRSLPRDACVVRLPDGVVFEENFASWSADEILKLVFDTAAPWSKAIADRLRALEDACHDLSRTDEASALYEALRDDASPALLAVVDRIVATHADLALRDRLLVPPTEPKLSNSTDAKG